MINDDGHTGETSGRGLGDLVEDLQRYMAARTPVEVYLWGQDEALLGFVVHVGDDHAVFARVFQVAWRNGYIALRFSAIEFVVPSSDAAFIHRCFTARDESLPASAPITTATFDGLLEAVPELFPMVVLRGQGGEPLDLGGQLTEIADGVLTMRVLSRSGHWEPDAAQVPSREVTELYFGSRYEQALELVGQLPDADGHDG